MEKLTCGTAANYDVRFEGEAGALAGASACLHLTEALRIPTVGIAVRCTPRVRLSVSTEPWTRRVSLNAFCNVDSLKAADFCSRSFHTRPLACVQDSSYIILPLAVPSPDRTHPELRSATSTPSAPRPLRDRDVLSFAPCHRRPRRRQSITWHPPPRTRTYVAPLPSPHECFDLELPQHRPLQPAPMASKLCLRTRATR
jgi:hypothetical protein